MPRLTRRLAILGLLLGANIAMAQEVIFVGPGGIIERTWRTKIFPAFEAQTNIKVKYVTATVLEGLSKVEAQRSNPSADVVTVTDETIAQFQKKDLFESLTPQTVPRIQEIYPSLKYPDNAGAPVYLLTTGLAYNAQIFKERGLPPPTSIYDLWNPELRDRIVIWTPATTTGIMMLLLLSRAEGGSEANVSKAFDKLKTLAPYVQFNRADEMTVLLQQRQAWIGWTNNQRAATLRNQGLPIEFAYLQEGIPVLTTGWAVIKNGPNRANAIKFMNWILSDEGQSLVVEHLEGAPVVSTVKLSDRLAAKVPSKEATAAFFVPNVEAMVRDRAAWLDRWAKEIERRN